MYLGIILKLFVGALLVIDISSFTIEDLQPNNCGIAFVESHPYHHTTTVGSTLCKRVKKYKSSVTRSTSSLNFVLVQGLNKWTKMNHQVGQKLAPTHALPITAHDRRQIFASEKLQRNIRVQKQGIKHHVFSVQFQSG